MLETPKKGERIDKQYKDIIIDPQFSCGADVLKMHRKRQFFVFLTNYGKSVFPQQTASLLFPDQLTADAKSKAVDKFVKLESTLTRLTSFAIYYSAYMLSSDNHPYIISDRICRFLISFLPKSRGKCNSDLNVLLPFMCSNIDTCGDIIGRILAAVCQKFSSDITFLYFLDFIDKYESSVVIDFVAKHVPRYHIAKDIVGKYITVIEMKLSDARCLFPQSWKKLYSVFTNKTLILKQRYPSTPNPMRPKLTIQESSEIFESVEYDENEENNGEEDENQGIIRIPRAAKTPYSEVKSILKTPSTAFSSQYSSAKKISFARETPKNDEDEDEMYIPSPPPIPKGGPLGVPKEISPGRYISSPTPKTPRSMISIDPDSSIPIPQFKTPKKPSYPKSPKHTPENLITLLKELELHPSDDLLLRIKVVLSVITEIPDVDLTTLFHEALIAFSRNDMQKSVFLLLSRLHMLVDPKKMLKMYLDVANDKNEIYKYNMNDVDMNYQSFLRIQGQNLPEHPLTLIDINIATHDELINGFELLCKWDTSYAGVSKIYNVVKKDPSLNLNDYFDPIGPTFKKFLITGLRKSASNDNFTALDPTIKALEERMQKGTEAVALQKKIESLNEKMLNVISENSPAGKNRSPKFVRTPSKVLVEFDEMSGKSDDEEDSTEVDESFVFE